MSTAPDSPRHPNDAILLLANVPFRSCQQRAQHLARTVARTRNVIYVDPNRSFLGALARRTQPIESDLPDGPAIVRPPVGLPFARSIPWFHHVNCRSSLAAIVDRVRDFRISAIVATFPDQLPIVEQLPRSAVLVYDVMDEFSLFLRPWQMKRYTRWHRALLGAADLTTASSNLLAEENASQTRRIEYLGNAIVADLPERCRSATPDASLAALPGPRLGYLGMISSWFDFDAVAALAEAWPHGSIILVGPRDVALPLLPANVHVRGPVRERDIPATLAAFDVGLIPFQRTREIDAVNPIKLYEYLAAGLPVVAADFESMTTFRDQVRCYCDPASAVAEVAAALDEPMTPRVVEERRSFASRHTWEDRAAKLLAWIDGARRRQRLIAA